MKRLAVLATTALLCVPAAHAAANPTQESHSVAHAAPVEEGSAPVTTAMATDASPRAGVGDGATATTGDSRAAAAATGPVIALKGRGFGHGRGMSQWGARGAAQKGLTASQILAFYYPGTTSASIGNPTVRVRLTAMGASPTTVVHEAGLTVTDGACTAALSQAGATAWRVVRTNGLWRLQGNYPVGGVVAWRDHPTPCTGFGTASSLTFVGDGSVAASVLTLRTPSGNRSYRGGLRAVVDNRPGAGGAVATVDVVPMDSYLRSVVPAEMPASWGLEAVKAQAVAARSYAADALGGSYSSDLCDTTACQVYPGLTSSNPEHPNSTAAVTATTGQIRKYGSSIAFTEFSSSNGGQITGSSVPYQVAKADAYDGVFAEAPDTWSYLTMPASAIESAWPTIGQFRSMATQRDGKGTWFGGRITDITLTGSAGTRVVSGDAFRSVMNLRSTWFIPVGSSVGTDFAANAFSDLIARDASGNLWNYPTDGRGSWLAKTLIASGRPAMPEILAPGDFSGDGIPDLMRRSSGGALTLDRGNGAGKIGSSVAVGSGWQIFNTVIAPGDLDGDGNVDLLARDAAGVLWLYPGNGAGSWKAKVSKGAGWGSLRELEAVGDFDGDGGTDLMGKDTAGNLYLLRFTSTGTYLGARSIGRGFQTYTGFTGLGDVDGDGAVDLVTKDATGALYAYRGNGAGGFRTRLKIGGGWSSLTFGS